MVAHMYTPLQVLTVGLTLAGFDLSRSSNPESAWNLRRFKSFYGSSHAAISELWEDLMMTLIDAARIDLDADCLEHFLLPCSF
jgi:hypothetical protein